MPVFTDALIGDTLSLSAEEFGAYCLLLFATWRNNGQALPDDAGDLAQICRVTPQRWRSHMRPKLARFFNIDDGHWHQKRLEKEWEFVSRRAEASRRNGPLGGRPRKNPDQTQEKPTGFTEQNLDHNQDETQTEPTHTHTQKKLASNGSRELPSAWAERAGADRAEAGLPPADLAAEWAKLLAKTDEPTEARWLAWALKARQKPSGNGSTDPGGLPEPPWPQRCRGWAKGYRWGADWGPQPDEPGCWAPVDLVADALSKRAAR